MNLDNNVKIESENGGKMDGKSNVTRDRWSKDIEFLMSCIALSVGLGNIWRFPFTALENGGGAFVIPYIIVLILIGKPMYYLEMIIGQFSSRGSIKVFDFSPVLRGIGYGQVISTGIVTTYYASLMALTIRYLFFSFSEILPWSNCKPEWSEPCIDSKLTNYFLNISEQSNSTKISTSAELFFLKDVLHEKESIDDGIGLPDLKLFGCLAISWMLVALILIRGVKSSGKVSYFLAIFPYIVLIILLVRALTLPGSLDGIIYFLKPQWSELLNAKVWYAAVTQVFFSLAICFGNIIMYSSYNRFGHNIHRDVNIVTSLDTLTSLLAGCTIFGILGHLAHETGTSNIQDVVKGGMGLAFIAYPDAIAKFKHMPQIFSALFFAMLFVLGIGSNIGMTSVIMTVIRDKFPKLKHWVVAVMIAVSGISIGCLYITPGGQYMINFLDFFGASIVAFVLAIFEIIGIGWIYGVKEICRDVEFMLNRKLGWYWRISWGIITPALMTAILIYTLVNLEPLRYGTYVYPNTAYVIGWCISAFGILQLPFWAIYAFYKQKGSNMKEKIMKSFQPTQNWGPNDLSLLEIYKQFCYERVQSQNIVGVGRGFLWKIQDNLFN